MELDKEAIIEMCDQIDLLEYASQSYDFKEKSGGYFTNCPLHIDKTPSLSIKKDENYFHCFSCGVGGNIINWLMHFEDMTFQQAIDKVCAMTGSEVSDFKISETVKFLREIQKRTNNKISKTQVSRDVLDESYYSKFAKDYPQLWLDEGITKEMIDKYEIRIDYNDNRIVYPVYDNNDNLIGAKGRTMYDNYKALDIIKYKNYTKIGTTDYFCGMKYNRENILKERKAIIFEGIKSGMKAEPWGYDYWVSSETSTLNNEQELILLKMHLKEVCIAYDNDVDIRKIMECTKRLRRFTNVTFVSNKNGLLGRKEEKNSPVDRGKDVWDYLYENRVRL